ncbi:Metallo-dependent phosphatase-like protein [Radiomyces spectabilis]|uniref:Metallo-dependent phosphatase-like protein n=1 Tax=Radiomyces spectabilis TaxID=64574 RepID=UPI00221F0739|nr:Metallo-dependent phosphatase-like protein [Radiomyces spectabilis]KAI8390854.1 Metallo-dependent phosphatase-like protein [Radiomyces spectabilis]
MKFPVISWVYLIAVLLCSLRACYLYWSSTHELRGAAPGLFWPQRLTTQPTYMSSTMKRNDSLTIGSEPDHLFYFIQISDLHLSKFRAKGHTLHFLHFIQSVLPVVKPRFVVVTGDLTDAKDQKRITSHQYIEEWLVYRNAIDQGANNTQWYDMRGNHDCFDLPSWESRVNMYREYGQSGLLTEEGQGLYTWQVNEHYGQYQFVAIDACPKRGPSRPLNFFGYLTSATMDRFAHALLSSWYNHTFVFSHYPTTTMVFGVSSQGYRLRDLARHYSVYFCGHFHRLAAGLGDMLQGYDTTTDTLELEVIDMKDHGVYRIVAVDHDLISFTDVRLPVKQMRKSGGSITPLTADHQILWPPKVQIPPAVLITNPKDARYTIKHKEPIHRIKDSTHIRFLVFTDVSPQDLTISVTLDGVLLETSFLSFVGNDTLPLWTLPWEPDRLAPRQQHVLKIQVRTSQGVSGSSSIVFRVDGMRSNIGGGVSEWIISTHMTTYFQCVSFLTITAMLSLLLIPKFYMHFHAQRQATQVSEKTTPLSRSRRILSQIHDIDQQTLPTLYNRLRRWIFIWALRFLRFPETQPYVWFTTFILLLAMMTLPWFRAEFIPSGATAGERYGTFYMYGLVFENEWVPIADSWMYACEQILLNGASFFMLFVWRSTTSHDIYCYGSPKAHTGKPRRQLNEYAWFKGLEVIYWLWRLSEVVALASFYGGVWPTLIQNMLVPWLIYVGAILGWGTGGLFSSAASRRLRMQDCEICQQHRHSETYDSKSDQFSMLMSDEDRCRVNILLSEESTSGSSASSTYVSPKAKSRKKKNPKSAL